MGTPPAVVGRGVVETFLAAAAVCGFLITWTLGVLAFGAWFINRAFTR